MKKLRRVTEAEVIAEFLKNEFYQEEFHQDREQFEDLVLAAQITDEPGNALRRALLFRRRGHMWRELPADTQWWEVQIEAAGFGTGQSLSQGAVAPGGEWKLPPERHCEANPDEAVPRTNPEFHRQSAGLELLPAQP